MEAGSALGLFGRVRRVNGARSCAEVSSRKGDTSLRAQTPFIMDRQVLMSRQKDADGVGSTKLPNNLPPGRGRRQTATSSSHSR